MDDAPAQETAAPAAQGSKKGNVVETVEEDAAAATKVVDEKAAAIERAVEQWVTIHLRNSPVSKATAAWNHLQSKLGELVELIKKEV